MIVTEGNRYVAFFDILGFSNLVETEGSKEVFIYTRGFLDLMIRSSMPKSVVNPDMSVDLKPSIISYINFSDSIVYYSLDDSYEAFRTMLKVCANFINVVICGPTRMIRGALSHGEFYADPENNAYVGKALIDAYQLEKDQEWLGVSLHSSIENTANFIRAQKEFSHLIVRSLVPLKGSSNKPFCLNWIDQDVIIGSFNVLKSLDDCLNIGLKCLNPLKDNPKETKKETEKLKKRISNTRKFIEHCQRMQ
ncbi:MAG: hypothetical protein BWK75_06635 [Candidatus Altiarchaeales archaeon A3]|nr:MAG: hypothetical protein BWK75_06635 [Candidatus Altiarchaeales archaeon A3]